MVPTRGSSSPARSSLSPLLSLSPSYGFFVEPSTPGAAPASHLSPAHDTRNHGVRNTAAGCAWLEVHAGGPSYLVFPPGAPPRISRAPPADSDRAALVEPIRTPHGRYLSLLTPPGLELRRNGFPALAVSVLRVRDQIAAGDSVLHVSEYVRPFIGPPTEEHIGKECSVCTTTIRAPEDGMESLVYVCPDCGTPMHYRAALEGESQPLECARLGSSCPSCTAPLVEEEGFRHVPEL